MANPYSGMQLGTNTMSNPGYVPPPPPPKKGKGRHMKTAGRRRRSHSSLSAMLGKPLKMLMGKKTRKNRRSSRR